MKKDTIKHMHLEEYYEHLFLLRNHLNGFNEKEIFHVLPGISKTPGFLVYDELLNPLEDIYIPTDFDLKESDNSIYTLLKAYNNTFLLYPFSAYTKKFRFNL